MTDGVELYWIPLGAGAGGGFVRWSGRCYEAIAASFGRRRRQQLFHSALEVSVDGVTSVIEMTPVWITRGERGVVGEGPVGLRGLRRWRAFRYEVRRWSGGSIPDVAEAIGGAVRVSSDAVVAGRVFELVPGVPLATWGPRRVGNRRHVELELCGLVVARERRHRHSTRFARQAAAERRAGTPESSRPRLPAARENPPASPRASRAA